MGTSIDLTISGISLDWSKNSMGIDHGFLFQEVDRTRHRSDQINYEYYAEHPELDLADSEAAFVRPLASVLPRLDLLGHTLSAARAEYDELMRHFVEMREDEGDDGQASPPLMTFDELLRVRMPLSAGWTG
ncbi:HEPN/Toprim-associated domain-containing protein [Xanthomonas campestris]|uniref:HEPN/Toprim-associated domain-containing protein n=1 Tax=Xanthomonas campestris TaxID=339 RepID=UPI00388D50F6